MSNAEIIEVLPSPLIGVESEPPYRRFIDSVPTKTFEDRDISYGLLCVAMQDPSTGEIIVVRKSDDEDSAKSRDWLVIRYNPDSDSLTEADVSVAEINSNDFGDQIHLKLWPQSMFEKSQDFKFSVDKLYRPDGRPASITRPKYYGRGVGPIPEVYHDADFTVDLLSGDLEYNRLASVTDIKAARSYPSRLGKVALI